MEPLTPAQALQQKVSNIPQEVIDAFNTLLASRYSGHSVTIRQNEVIDLILKNLNYEVDYNGDPAQTYSRQDIFNQHWLDIEPLYEKNGWKVTYDKPAYCETYEPFFVFEPKSTK